MTRDFITFEQFQASRESCADIGKALDIDMGILEPVPGNLYLGSLYIEARASFWPDESKAKGAWHLLIENTETFSDDLAVLERELYEYGCKSGPCEPRRIGALVTEYKAWNQRNGLNLGSADEHWHDESLTENQREWLRGFSQRWDEAAQRDTSQFWIWFDAQTSKAKETTIGQLMASVGFHVTHTGGGCLAWEKSTQGCPWSLWITDESTLGTDRAESERCFGAMLIHDDNGDFVNGPQDATISECVTWGNEALAEKASEPDAPKAACQHRNDGRGRCIDCGAFL